MYDDILIPTDASPGAEEAISEAIELAALTDATVHALYVVDTTNYPTLPDGKWATVEEALEGEGKRAVDAIADRAADAGLDAVTAVETGTPHKEILDYAETNDVDLVVMGTHGQTGIDKVLLGSVTENVLRESDQSVLVKNIGDRE
ncbi:universal stress protein [Halorientalis brevis]|uniref:Universal stress protein n=1 Tax=Halorientalis brevis TaxID=1126241 RepID=A0ABD6C9P7_9EURY|nr:universal stress protein [Halorientalis brevis]